MGNQEVDLQFRSGKDKSWVLNHRQLCDVELLINAGFAPLTGFLTRQDYNCVLEKMRLFGGTLWPMPICLDVNEKFASLLEINDRIHLKDQEGFTIALMDISDIWHPDKEYEANKLFGTTDETHFGVDYLFKNTGKIYLGGNLFSVNMPRYYDYIQYRLNPKQLRQKLKHLGWDKIVGFQTRNPMHQAHLELTLKAMKDYNAKLLLQPVVGCTKTGDIDYFTRVKCYQKVLSRYPNNSVILNLLPLAMRMAGPRKALWHAIIRKNYACTHFIIGRDHAGPGKNRDGKHFYDPYAAQKLVQSYQEEIGLKVISFQEMVYVANKNRYLPINETDKKDDILSISGTELRNKLVIGDEIPEWFSYQEIIEELRKAQPPKLEQGFTIFFTGLSGAGKSTLANALLIKLKEFENRPIILLDGDILRNNLSSELGFSKAHRDLNIQRIGFVAEQITRCKGIAICAPIAPYEVMRQHVRKEISAYGGFLEVYVATSLEVCEKRDPKGLYRKARRGLIKSFTGIDDPYEAPKRPDVILDTSKIEISSGIDMILKKLSNLGYIKQFNHCSKTEKSQRTRKRVA